MNVQQLIEALQAMPRHLPVHVAVKSSSENGGGGDTDYLYTLDCVQENFPSQGNMAVIQINDDPR